jgi:hypothetical protein
MCCLAAISVVVITVVVITVMVEEYWGDWKALGIHAVGGLFLVGLLGSFCVPLLIIALATLGLLFDLAIIEPVARIVDRDALDRLIKIGCLLLLVLGFHFDLLAS